jgi:hypothetical protein
MFAKRKEVIVRDQPDLAVEPQVTERTTYVEDHRPRFLLGLILGVGLLAGGVATFAHQQGSYAIVGASLDRSLGRATHDTAKASADAAHQFGDAAQSAGDAIKAQTDKTRTGRTDTN